MTRFDVNCVTLTLHEKEFDKLVIETHKCFSDESMKTTYKVI